MANILHFINSLLGQMVNVIRSMNPWDVVDILLVTFVYL